MSFFREWAGEFKVGIVLLLMVLGLFVLVYNPDAHANVAGRLQLQDMTPIPGYNRSYIYTFCDPVNGDLYVVSDRGGVDINRDRCQKNPSK